MASVTSSLDAHHPHRPSGVTSQLALVNSQLGILTYLNGAPYGIPAFSLANDHIQEIDFIVNPDKLRGIQPLT